MEKGAVVDLPHLGAKSSSFVAYYIKAVHPQLHHTAQASVQSWQRDRWLGLGCGQRHGHRCRPCASDYCLDHELAIAGIVLVCFGVPLLPAFFFQLGHSLIKSCKGDCMTQRRKLQMMQMVVIVLIQYLVLGCFRQFCCEWAPAVRKQETDF